MSTSSSSLRSYIPLGLRSTLGAMALIFAAYSSASRLPAATPGNSPPSAKVWLSDLPEKDVSVGWKQFGKNGRAGFEDVAIAIENVKCPHGLGMHPDAHAQYELGKKYRTFRGTAAMNNTANPGSAAPVVFRVLGDGKLLWQSYGLHRVGDAQPCMLDITGAAILRLEVIYRPGAKDDRSDASGKV